jgi:hypothetical protein
MKNFYIFCFMMWGFFGLVGAVVAGFYLPILNAIYAAVMWLAGCVLFGLAVLIMEAAKGMQYESVEDIKVQDERYR